MTTALDGHIEVDDHGIARIAETRLKVVHLVIDQMAHGSTPEQMCRQFPPLTLAQVYAALTYYHDHKPEMDAQIERSLVDAQQMHRAAGDQFTRDELLRRLGGSSRATPDHP